MKKLVLLFSAFLFSLPLFAQAPTAAWINEIHYDNPGTDVGEFIEVVVNQEFTDLTNFQVYLYNGSSTTLVFYDSLTLDQFQVGTTANGFTFYVDSISGIQNGSPDGMAIAYNNILIPGQFLSYEGTFTAINGPANGVESVDIGVSEGTQLTGSLGLVGSGTSYTDFTWDTLTTATPGMPNDNQLLPVELTSFSAVNIKSGVMLNWTTATEINNAGFEIERKSSNYNWKKIGFVRGNGNSTLPIKYSFADNLLNTGKYQYRLKQIDFNGSYKYSKIVEVNLSDIPVNYQLNQNYPNPFNPSTTISYSIPKASFVTIKIYNILGNEVAALVNQEKPAGKYEINFNAIHLSSGMYIYKLSAGNFNEMKKMILMK